MPIRRVFAALGAGCLVALGAAPVHAATYSADLDFQAADQSMWSQGNAGVFDFERFIGPQWSESGQVGGVTQVTTPEIVLVPEICAWGVCTPEVAIPAANLGTYGATIGGQTDGQIGFDLDVHMDTGSVNVAYPGTATFLYPDAADILPGASTLAIQTAFNEGSTALSTNFPEASLTLDFVFDVYAAGGFQACLVSCGSLNFPTIDVDQTIPLLDIDSNTAQVTFDLGFTTIGAQLPDLDTAVSGTNALGNLVSSGIADDPLIDLDVDLDLIATTLLGLPALTQEVGIGGASAGFTLLDVLVGAEVKLLQQFVFDPVLMVRLDASDGQSVTGAVGSALSFNAFAGGETTVTPTFFLQNNFRNTTSLRIDPTFDLEALAAHLGLDLPSVVNSLGVGDVNLNFGPLFEVHASVPGPDVKVFDQSWQIPFAPIVGQSFVVRVPEPSTLALLGLGVALLGAGALRRRQGRRVEADTALA